MVRTKQQEQHKQTRKNITKASVFNRHEEPPSRSRSPSASAWVASLADWGGTGFSCGRPFRMRSGCFFVSLFFLESIQVQNQKSFAFFHRKRPTRQTILASQCFRCGCSGRPRHRTVLLRLDAVGCEQNYEFNWPFWCGFSDVRHTQRFMVQERTEGLTFCLI